MIEDMLTGKGLQAIEQQVSQKTITFFCLVAASYPCPGYAPLYWQHGGAKLTLRRRRADGVKGPNLTRTEVPIKDTHSGRKHNGH